MLGITIPAAQPLNMLRPQDVRAEEAPYATELERPDVEIVWLLVVDAVDLDEV